MSPEPCSIVMHYNIVRPFIGALLLMNQAGLLQLAAEKSWTIRSWSVIPCYLVLSKRFAYKDTGQGGLEYRDPKQSRILRLKGF